MPKKAKCLLLFSGGLDSILAAKILIEQGIKVLGLTFKSCFFDGKQAKKAALQFHSGQAKEIGLKLKIINISKEHLKIVKRPKYGYGKNMNPCIDCHLLMLKKAKEIMNKGGFDFIATGEVLGERPMSQNKNVLCLLEKQSGLKGYLLRPLSAKLLEPTIAEKEGIVGREKLFSISGRQRKKQLTLAKKFKIKNYPTPSGGCCLTDLQFSKRLKKLLEKWPRADCDDMKLLKFGRHFWVNQRIGADKKTADKSGFNWFLVVVGRDDSENKGIKKLKRKGDLIVELKKIPGPTTLVRGKRKVPESVINRVKELTKKYTNKAGSKKEIMYLIYY